MKYRLVTLLLCLICTSLLAKQLPIEHFVKQGDYLDMTLSPDGKHVLARVRSQGKIALLILDTNTMKLVSGIKSRDKDEVHSAVWINNERIVYQYAEKHYYLDTPIPTGELYAINVDGSKNIQLYGYRASDARTGTRISNKDDNFASALIINNLDSDDDHILIAEYPWTMVGNDYYDYRKKKPIISKINVYNGRKRKQEVLPHPGATAIATANGDVNFMYWHDEQDKQHSAYRTDKDSEWVNLKLAFDTKQTLLPIKIDQSSQKVYLNGRIGDTELHTIYQLDLVSGNLTPVFENITSDVEYTDFDPIIGSPLIAETIPNKPNYHYADPKNAVSQIHQQLVEAFAGQTVRITSRSKDNQLLLIRVSSDVNPGEYYIFNRNIMDAKFLWANRSWLDPRDMRQKHPFNFETKDGITINGYLTLPMVKESSNPPPLVVMVHGGPHQTRDYWNFDSEVQLLANRGYAVLQVNFRGSDGYGAEFVRLGYRQWGGKMIDDIIEATQWTVKQGKVNPKKMCIYGASYGGYAALMATVKSPELFKCTIGYVGIYDLNYAYSESDTMKALGGEAYLNKVIGTVKLELDEFSPINFADKITAQVMLIHGAKDQRVPEINAESMLKALKSEGKDALYLSFANSGHGVWDVKNRLKLYQGLVSFLDKNISSKPD